MLNISIVLYKTRAEELLPLLDELLKVRHLRHIYLVDNSPVKSEEFASLPLPIVYIFNNANLGYGKAHNIALRESVYDEVPYHLVINSDIEVKAADIEYLLDFIGQNPLVGQIMPKVVYPDGTVQYLAKLLPSPWDLIARRFLPKRWTQKRTERYELRFRSGRR